MKPLIKLVFIFVLTLSLGGCATPQNIKEKSAASLELYKNVSMASQNLSYAMNSEFELRDQYDHQLKVRNGKEAPIFTCLICPEINENTAAVKKNFKVIHLNFEQARLLHGTVDRFLRIDVVNLEDVNELSSKTTILLDK